MTQKQTQNSANTNKISSTYIMFITFIVVIVSIAALLMASNAFLDGDTLAASFLGIIGFIALTLAVFVFFQSRKQAQEVKIEIPKVMTTVECKQCGYKNIREFQRGDFVFKELDTCQKCPETKQMITAIYKEVKEKEKTYGV